MCGVGMTPQEEFDVWWQEVESKRTSTEPADPLVKLVARAAFFAGFVTATAKYSGTK